LSGCALHAHRFDHMSPGQKAFWLDMERHSEETDPSGLFRDYCELLASGGLPCVYEASERESPGTPLTYHFYRIWWGWRSNAITG
jgi:hypothetical protein